MYCTYFLRKRKELRVDIKIFIEYYLYHTFFSSNQNLNIFSRILRTNPNPKNFNSCTIASDSFDVWSFEIFTHPSYLVANTTH